MPRSFAPIGTAAVAFALAAFAATDQYTARFPRAAVTRFRSTIQDVAIHPSARHDRSHMLVAAATPSLVADDDGGAFELAMAPEGALAPPPQTGGRADPLPPVITTPAGSGAVEQRAEGARPPAATVASFDGLGVDFQGPQGSARLRNPSDNSLAVGPNHIVQIVNTRMAIFTKKGAMYDTTGKVLYGPVETNNVFKGFGGACESRNNGDAVVRYDQLADRWLIVMPIFSKIPPVADEPAPPAAGQPAAVSRPGEGGPPGSAAKLYEPPPPPPAVPGADSLAARGRGRGRGVGGPPVAEQPGHYAMCYAVSQGPSPFGPYYRYEFLRPLFPD
jgi:hypothetical protein